MAAAVNRAIATVGRRVYNQHPVTPTVRARRARMTAGVSDSHWIGLLQDGDPFAAQVAEECRRLLDRLPDAEMRAIATWKMEGETAPDIAARLGCALSTVERRLRLIRQLWEGEDEP